jgi:NodT family efflux transporter outer membrane factor (OMF) lipoprotein
MKTLCLFLILLFSVGCSVHSTQANKTALPLPDSFSETRGETSPSSDIGRWWERFGDEQLNALMDEAFRHNLDLTQAYERLKQLEAVIKITGSSESPSLNLNASAGRVRQQGLSGMTTSNSYTLSIAAGYELDLWKKLKSRTNAARLNALASRQDIKALYITLSAQLADLYYLAVEQRAQLELSDRIIASYEDTLNRIRQRYEEGLVSASELYKARQSLAAVKAQRPVFETNLAVTQHALSVLLGRFPEKETLKSIAQLPKAPEAFPAGIPSQLLTRRPDIEAALLRLRASDEQVGAAIADRFPSFNLTAGYGGSSSTLKNILDSPNIFWNLLLNIAQPLLDGGKRKAEVERSKAVFRENLARYHQTVLRAFQEVEDALARNHATEQRIAALEKKASAASDSLRLAMNKYMQGLTDYLPVLEAQQRLYEAEGALLSARRQLISDRIQLARALGGDWAEQLIQNRLTADIRKEKAK